MSDLNLLDILLQHKSVKLTVCNNKYILFTTERWHINLQM